MAQDLEIQSGNLTLHQQHLFDVVHQQAYEVRRRAEKECRKLKMGAVPWSPQLKILWEKLYLWKLLLKGFQGCRTSSRKILRLLKRTGLVEAEMTLALHEARKRYNNSKKQYAKKSRKNFIQSSSSAPMQAHFKLAKGQARISRFQRMEQKEETWRRRRAQGKGFLGGLREIKVQATPGDEDNESNWLTCTARRHVEDGCMQENRARYDQSRFPYPTPPMTEPLYSAFNGPFAEANSHDLLQGAFLPPTPSSALFWKTVAVLMVCPINISEFLWMIMFVFG